MQGLFFSITSNVIVPQQDTFLLPGALSIQNLSDKLKVIFLYVISYCKLVFAITNWWETGSAYYTDKCEIFTSSWFLSPIVVIWKWIISYALFLVTADYLHLKKKIEKEGRENINQKIRNKSLFQISDFMLLKNI